VIPGPVFAGPVFRSLGRLPAQRPLNASRSLEKNPC